MVDQSVTSVARSYLRALQEQGIAIHFGVIFGSWARNAAQQWSDIDLIVVSPQFDNMSNRRYIDLLWRQAARVDSRIEPVACGEKQWEEEDASVILDIARREGHRVAIEADITTPPGAAD
jgi:uncharacterized protein